MLALTRIFPEAMRTQDDWSNVAYFSALLVVVTAGALRAVQGGLVRHLRHAAIWVALAAVAALGFAYREELAGVPRHLQLAFSTGRAVTVGDHELEIPQDDQGAFEVIGRVDGQPVRFLIDTGASDTVLSPADARRLGIDPGKLRYDEEAETANGRGYAAPYVVRRLEVGPIALENFRVAINQAPMNGSLLGLSFLNRLASFEIHGRKLFLKWRDGAGG